MWHSGPRGSTSHPESAEQWVAPKPCDEVGVAGDDAGLGPAKQLIAGESHHIHTGLQAVRDERFSDDSRR